MIQRYENNGYMEDFRPEPNGEWVKYEDLQSRVERLEAALRHAIDWIDNADEGAFGLRDEVSFRLTATLTNDAGGA